jgi:proton-translocating NADH-quinone oxidoreductase chain M
MLLGIVVIIVKTGTTNMIEIREIMRIKPMGWEIEKWIWLGFFLSFATKVPMIPLHLWLPEAHVEAPTGGSIVLASILLKLGVYGFYRILIEGMPEVSRYYTPLIYVLGVVGVIYASLTAIRQTDLKRIIAYASIAHMNLVMIGLFSWTIEGVQGALLQSVSHGFVASGLFACVGIIYERYHTRIITYYGGIIEIMPVYGICLLIFMLANISLPGTSSFVGEFLILVGIGKVSIIIMILGGLGVILSAIYSLWVYNRISFGNYKGEYMVEKVEDITGEELSIIIPYIIMIMVIGIWPKMITMYL